MGGDLSKRVWFTLGALLVYRLGTHVPIPGLAGRGPPRSLQSIPGHHRRVLSLQAWGASPGLFDALYRRWLSGRISIFAFSRPSLPGRQRPHAAGELRPARRYGLIGSRAARYWADREVPSVYPLPDHPSLGPSGLLSWPCCWNRTHSRTIWGFLPCSASPGPVFRLTTVLSRSSRATLFVTWLAEQISRHGVGNGILLILFSGLAVYLPSAMGTILELSRTRGPERRNDHRISRAHGGSLRPHPAHGTGPDTTRRARFPARNRR